jgi:hypothetical protein
MKDTFLEHLKDCHVRNPGTDYHQSWMPLDNFNRVETNEVYQVSLVIEDE